MRRSISPALNWVSRVSFAYMGGEYRVRGSKFKVQSSWFKVHGSKSSDNPEPCTLSLELAAAKRHRYGTKKPHCCEMEYPDFSSIQMAPPPFWIYSVIPCMAHIYDGVIIHKT